MSDCLHCDINELIREHVERGTDDLVEIASMMAESVADLVLLASEGVERTSWRMRFQRSGRWSWRRAARSRAPPAPPIKSPATATFRFDTRLARKAAPSEAVTPASSCSAQPQALPAPQKQRG